MPKTSSNKIAGQLRAEIAKWRGRSRVTKNSNHIQYMKIKSTFSNLEKELPKQKLKEMAEELGIFSMKRMIIDCSI